MNLKNTLAIATLIFGSCFVLFASADATFDVGISSFAAILYEQVAAASTGDIVISPFSAQTILSVALQGAVDQTASEMISGLQFSGSTPTLIAQSYQTALAPLQTNPSMKTANKIYLQDTYATSAQFNEIVTQDFYTSAELLDFAASADAANEINNWVASETNGLITDLIAASDLSADTKMVLVNAIYFNGNWTTPFYTQNTFDDTFTTDSNTTAEIPFMHVTDYFKYAELPDIDAKVIELTYINSTMSMIVILPNDVDGIANLESQLNTIDFQTLSSQLRSENVAVSLPKFTTSFSVHLKDALENMGMTTMFTDAANFSNMLQDKGSLKVSQVVQKAYIEVNEQGATAAAATAVIMVSILEISFPLLPPKVFNANHPFIYFLQEDNQYPYFIGRFMNRAS